MASRCHQSLSGRLSKSIAGGTAASGALYPLYWMRVYNSNRVPPMRRVQFIEILDQTWFPRSLRDATTDALQFLVNLGNLYKPVVPHLRKALEIARTHHVVDICSGGGGPWLRLYQVFEEDEKFPVDICLTDKYPNIGAFEHARAISQSKINFHASPIDATQIPSELKGFRTLLRPSTTSRLRKLASFSKMSSTFNKESASSRSHGDIPLPFSSPAWCRSWLL